MDSHHEERISQLLGEIRENESSTVSDDSRTQAGMSACRDWYDSPHQEQSDEHLDGGSYNRDEGMLGQFLREINDMFGQTLLFIRQVTNRSIS